MRELARSQGFPDHFVFESINNNVVTVSDCIAMLGSSTLFPPLIWILDAPADRECCSVVSGGCAWKNTARCAFQAMAR